MKNFIALSSSSKKALHVAKISASLPVNILIQGEIGVGKKLLAKEILPQSESFCAVELEKQIQQKLINIQSYKSLLVYEIDKLINKKQFFEKVKNIRIIATTKNSYEDSNNNFPIKISLENLDKRKEDLEELTKIYIDEAQQIYSSDKKIDDIKIDISKNGLSLKESIFKSVLLNSLSKDEIMDTMYNYFIQEFSNEKKTYKELLEIFERPLLKASKKVFKSQVKMAENLDLNRITLRKKLTTYFKDN